MEEKEKQDLPEESKVEEVTVKLDATGVEEAVKKGIEEGMKNAAPEALPGAPAVDVSAKEEKDLSKYSLRKAILKKAQMQNGEGKLDGIEGEMHQEAIREAKGTGREISGLGIPTLYLNRATLQATTDATGGYTVAQDTIGFIESLQNNMASVQAGAQFMPGLVGDVKLPRLASDSVATWRTEGGVATQSDPVFEGPTMTPHRLTAYTVYSMQLLRQSTLNIDNIVSNTLSYAIANALETAAFEGDGTSQVPVGILNGTNVNDATHGSSNPTVASWANIVNMEKMVAVDNALAAKMAFILKATAAAKLKTTTRDSTAGGYIWENDPLLGGTIDGYPAYVSNIFTNDTVIFGNFAELLFGQWGGLDLLINPYSRDTYAEVRVVIAGYFDIALRHGQSFARINDLKLT